MYLATLFRIPSRPWESEYAPSGAEENYSILLGYDRITFIYTIIVKA